MGSYSIGDHAVETKVFHRSLRIEPLHVVSGKGCTLTLDNGKEILDAAAGAAVACIGHGDERVKQALMRQMDGVSYIHAQVYTAAPIEDLARVMIESTEGKMSRVIFTSSGSESMEVAMKLARQYHLENGQPTRNIFISRGQSYHGATLGTLALSGHLARRSRYEPLMLSNMIKTAPCNAYRNQDPSESNENYVSRLQRQLEKDIQAVGADRVCAFVAETVGGASVGCIPAVPGYFKAVREVCDKYGVLLILDEIMCGFGRTGSMHAWQQEGIIPDLQAVAKGLGGGYVPIGAVLLNHRVFDVMNRGSGNLSHGQTYQSHVLACAAALEVQRILRADSLVERCRQMGQYLQMQLRSHLIDVPHVGNIRGRGLFIGIELVKDKITKEPFPLSTNVAARVHAIALQNGLATYPGTGTADGSRGDHILLAPPFIITETEIDLLVDVVRDAIIIVGNQIESQNGVR